MFHTSIRDYAGFLIASIVVFVFAIVFIIDEYLYRKKANVSLKNKHVLITGGSSGIGKSIAIEAVSRGAYVTLVARDEKKLNEAKHEVLKHAIYSTQRVFTLSLDVQGDYSEIVKGIASSEEECGPVFMLVNSAGRAICGKLEDLSPADIKDLCNLNYMGSILMSKGVVEGMKSRKEGRIVFVSSAAGLLGIYGLSAYCASKFALRGLAEALHMETVCHGVKVTVAYPPDTDTPGFAVEQLGKPKETRLICESGGLFQPDVVARQIVKDSLAGKFSSYVGLDGFLLTTLSAGMSPSYSLSQLITEFGTLGLFRLMAAFYAVSFKRIIQQCMAEKNHSKKAE